MSAVIKEPYYAGRPTNCTPDIIQQALDYISDNEEINFKSHDHAVPSVVGLCRVINRGKSTIYNWIEKKGHPFVDIVKAINDYQELTLVNGSLRSVFNPKISAMMLAKHGYSDNDNGGSTGITINVDRNASIQLTDNGITISTLEQQADNTLETVIEHESDKISND